MNDFMFWGYIWFYGGYNSRKIGWCLSSFFLNDFIVLTICAGREFQIGGGRGNVVDKWAVREVFRIEVKSVSLSKPGKSEDGFFCDAFLNAPVNFEIL